MPHHQWTLLVFCVLPALGCAPTPGIRAVTDAAHFGFIGNADDIARAKLDPSIRYLRVQRGRQIALLALGYIDPHPDGDIEVWYSAAGEVIKLQNGRFVGTAGGETEWLHVSFEGLPRWSSMGDEATYVRTRDVNPGYHFGLREQLTVKRIPPPPDHRLQAVPADSLSWFEERAPELGKVGTARYAVETRQAADSRVVYAEQCVSEIVCLSWQRWDPPDGVSR